jgi:ComF family protein
MPLSVNRNAAAQVDEAPVDEAAIGEAAADEAAVDDAVVETDRSRLIDRLWPARCLVCGERGQAQRDLCGACARSLPWHRSACLRCAMPLPASPDIAAAMVCGECLQRPPPLAQTHAAFAYAHPLDRLLPRFKFHGDLAAGRLLAQLAFDAFVACERPDALLAIPLHRDRLRERGYDQALELARPLARALRIPLRQEVLLRLRATAPQSRLDAPQRRRNLRDAFSIAEGAKALPAHVVLVDDVMTTGATLHAAAKTLRRAGVERIDAWICARVS